MTFLETHPWLTFRADLRDLPLKTWIQLGESTAKCEHITDVPLKPSIAEELHKIYLTKGIQATTAIEGNTLTEEEVRRIIEGNAKIPASKEYLKQETENILKACNLIARHIEENLQIDITPERICEYNRIVLENFTLQDYVHPGLFRDKNVTVGRYRGADPSEIPNLVERLCVWINGDDFREIEGCHPIVLAILKAIFAQIYIAWIHPFGDGNGRTARLIEFKILAQSGVPLPAAHLLSNHYNSTRSEYYNQLDKTSKTGGKIIDFISYAVQGFLDGLNEQLEKIREQQIQIALENYIHEEFREKKGDTWRRRRHVALDLANYGKPVKRTEIPLISERLNEAYRNMTDRAISRDLRSLLEMGLIERIDDRFQINKKPIMAFMPVRKV